MVGIVLINYKNSEDTIECLESIQKSHYQDYQVVVVDNGSCDDSVAQLKVWARDKQKITVVESVDNLGFSGGNNFGAKYMAQNHRVDYLWFLNNDTVIDHDAIKEQIQTMSQDDSIAAVGAKLLLYDKRDVLQCLGGCRMNLLYPLPVAYSGGEKDFELDDREIKGSIAGASFFVRSKVFGEIGEWDENYFLQAEEDDLSLRLRRAGYKLYLSSKARIYHKEGASCSRKVVIRRFLWEKTKRVSFGSFLMLGYYDFRNRIYFAKKNMSFFLKAYFFVVFLPLYFIANIVAVILFDDRKIDRIGFLFHALHDGIIGLVGERKVGVVE